MLTINPATFRIALSATLHCLTGCAIGEVLGVAIGTALGWGDMQTIALAVVLAFIFGYGFTMRPLVMSGIGFTTALGMALAADTYTIAVMEIVDNAIILAIPGAMEAGLGDALFWGSLAFALGVAFLFALPLSYYLVSRGKGHAVIHGRHDGAEDDGIPEVRHASSGHMQRTGRHGH